MDDHAHQHEAGGGTGIEARLAALRATRGRAFWKGLDELVDMPAFVEHVERVHPGHGRELADPLVRRDVIKLLGASLALAGMGACTRQPQERILPYTRAPEGLIPGQALHFATAMPWASGALGLLAESHMGRPTKLEGNPDHPASEGAADVFAQAAVLSLYDPERARTVLRGGHISTWRSFEEALAAELALEEQRRGAGLAILTGSVTSPSLLAQIHAALRRFPAARWVQYEPLHRDAARQGALLAFGQDVGVRLHLERARVVLALDADLFRGPPGVLAMRQLYARSQQRLDPANVKRLYAVESTPTLFGAKAVHRAPAAPWEVAAVASAVARALGVRSRGQELRPELASFAQAAADDLAAHRGACVVVAGDEQPPVVHALTHALNQALGNVGATVTYGATPELVPEDQGRALAGLVRRMRGEGEDESGAVDMLLILGANPVHTAPADLGFAEALQSVRTRVHLALEEDETSVLCHWHLPESHFLEAWGDASAFDGTLAIVQPLIAPLYQTRSALELMSLVAGQPQSGYELVRSFWQARALGGADFESGWRRALRDGVLAGTSDPARSVSAAAGRGEVPLDTLDLEGPPQTGLTALFRPSPSLWDGRFANNAWLQELPQPLTKLTWDNAAYLSPETARRIGVSSGDVLALASGTRTLHAPVWILPGHADGCVTLPLGHGRTRTGRVGSGVGFDAYKLRTAAAPWAAEVQVGLTRERHFFATTQHHERMEGRHLVRRVTTQELERGLRDGHGMTWGSVAAKDSLYAPWRYDGQAWGMVIDLDACTGCNACVIACQAENNIPVVGRKQVAAGREMHWLRVDRYFEGPPEAPRIHFQPIVCMHCENAPCEYVCPVAATVHGPEGLNEMVYNRCIGTRYCSNNCPYKVRRFNFLDYQDVRESVRMQRNPDVSVRSRGVMEKCTYCVQRIQEARIAARKAGRAVADGEVVTACQQTCPAEAIVFGDINDPQSAVSALRARPQHYGLLVELNTVPRTTYLAELSAPNPALAGEGQGEGD